MKKMMVGVVCFMTAMSVIAETAEQAWCRITDELMRKRSPEAFAYVGNNPSLPNVLLYGDSISIGYTPAVREKLAGHANVYRINRNGDWSGRVVSFIEELEKTMRNPELSNPWNFQWDVIVFNTGMHDLKYLNGRKLDAEDGKRQCPPDQYAANLRKNVEWLRATFPQAKLIFVTTTPIPEGAEGRRPGDAILYNRAALDVLKNYPEVAVADLYTISKANQDAWCKKTGDIHYNLAGSAAQGEWLAAFILPLLGK